MATAAAALLSSMTCSTVTETATQKAPATLRIRGRDAESDIDSIAPTPRKRRSAAGAAAAVTAATGRKLGGRGCAAAARTYERPWVESKADRRARIERAAAVSTHGSLFIQQLVQQAQDAHDQCNAWKAEIGARATYCHDATESVVAGGGLAVAGKHWTEWIDLDSLPAGVRAKLAETLEDELSPTQLRTIAFGRRAGSCSPPPASAPAPPAAPAPEKPEVNPEHQAASPRSQQRREVFARAAELLVATKPPLPPAAAKVDSGLSALRREKLRTSPVKFGASLPSDSTATAGISAF